MAEGRRLSPPRSVLGRRFIPDPLLNEPVTLQAAIDTLCAFYRFPRRNDPFHHLVAIIHIILTRPVESNAIAFDASPDPFRDGDIHAEPLNGSPVGIAQEAECSL